MKTMIQEAFANSLYVQVGQQMQNIIKDAVIADLNKFYTDQAFLDNLTKSVQECKLGLEVALRLGSKV